LTTVSTNIDSSSRQNIVRHTNIIDITITIVKFFFLFKV